MSTTILCQVARAENPYYLEDVDMHIGSIEELCYYLQNHLPLIDLSFFSMHLLDWIEGELGATRLAQTLHRILTEVPDPKLLDLILPVMQEAGWLNTEEERAMREELRDVPGFPVPPQYAHPIVLERMIRVLREGRAASVSEAYDTMKSDLKSLNASVTVTQKEHDEVVTVKPLFLVCGYADELREGGPNGENT